MSQTDLYLFSGITLGATTICLAGALLFDRLRLRSLEPAVRMKRDAIASSFLIGAIIGTTALLCACVIVLGDLVKLGSRL